jgi:hypothetical protein
MSQRQARTFAKKTNEKAEGAHHISHFALRTTTKGKVKIIPQNKKTKKKKKTLINHQKNCILNPKTCIIENQKNNGTN